MGRFLPEKFFPSCLLNLLVPSPPFPLWKDKSLLLPTVYPRGSFHFHTCVFIWPFRVCVCGRGRVRGLSPGNVSSKPPPPARLRPASSARWASELVQALPQVLLCALEYWFFSVCAPLCKKNQYFSSSSTARGSVMEPACWCNVRGPPSATEVRQRQCASLFHCLLHGQGRGSAYACIYQRKLLGSIENGGAEGGGVKVMAANVLLSIYVRILT